MTVITNIIGRDFTVHVCDSLRSITLSNNDGIPEQTVGDFGPKTVKVSQFHGAISVFGLMKWFDWEIIPLLEAEAQRAVQNNLKSAAHFASRIHKLIQPLYQDFTLTKSLGLHFTAYELIDDMWVPELFYISNFRGIRTNPVIYAGGPMIAHQRMTFFRLSNETRYDFQNHGKKENRLAVAESLEQGAVYLFQNGDPSLFELDHIPHLIALESEIPQNLPPAEFCARLAMCKVQSIINLQLNREIAERKVGGVCHCLIIRPNTIELFDSPTGLEHFAGA
jgi:hypothetical protein